MRGFFDAIDRGAFPIGGETTFDIYLNAWDSACGTSKCGGVVTGRSAGPYIIKRTLAALRKGAILQRSGAQRVFKGLGVAKRYCRRDSIGNSFVRGWPEPPGSPYGVGRISPPPPFFLLPNILAMPSSERRSWLGSQPFRLFGSFALGNARFTGVSLGRIIVGVKTPTRNNEGHFRRTTATGAYAPVFSIYPDVLRGAAHGPTGPGYKPCRLRLRPRCSCTRDEVPPGASRKIRGRFQSATTDSLTMRLQDGQTHTLQKQAVRKVLTRRPFLKRWPRMGRLGGPLRDSRYSVKRKRNCTRSHCYSLSSPHTARSSFFSLVGNGRAFTKSRLNTGSDQQEARSPEPWATLPASRKIHAATECPPASQAQVPFPGARIDPDAGGGYVSTSTRYNGASFVSGS